MVKYHQPLRLSCIEAKWPPIFFFFLKYNLLVTWDKSRKKEEWCRTKRRGNDIWKSNHLGLEVFTSSAPKRSTTILSCLHKLAKIEVDSKRKLLLSCYYIVTLLINLPFGSLFSTSTMEVTCTQPICVKFKAVFRVQVVIFDHCPFSNAIMT